MEKKYKKMAALVIGLAVLGLNLEYAIGDYGINSGKVLYGILAQGSGSGDGSGGSGGSGSGSGYNINESSCSITIEGKVGSSFSLFGIIYTLISEVELDIDMDTIVTATLSFENVNIKCSIDGPYSCTPLTCADFWKGI